MAKKKNKNPNVPPEKTRNRKQPKSGEAQSTFTNDQLSRDKGKNIAQKFAVWLGIVAALLTIVTFVLDLPGKLRKNWLPASTRYYGKVVDAAGNGVAGAEIIVLQSAGGDTVGIGRTLENGDFNFIIKARRESSVFVTVHKSGQIGFSEYKVLAAGDKILFK